VHELSVAETIIDTVLGEIERKQLPPVQTIAVQVGALSAVDPEALQFAFEAIRVDTPLAATALEIESVPVCGQCNDCQRPFSVEDLVFACPFCQSGRIQLTQGEELHIAYLEVEDPMGSSQNTASRAGK
jgi:hydrogenase nickel incorporation protein HypA/HybF